MSRVHPYGGQPVGLATKHGKQQVIGPALARMPGLQVIVPERLDTDLLGTFTGEIERPAPPRETALLKARLGLRATGLSRALSSEGAFGPHPQSFLLAGALEILAFVDDELGIEITEQRLTHHTNFGHTTTAALDAPTQHFLTRVGFPSHALIVRPNIGTPDETLVKGIVGGDALADAITRCARASPDGLAQVQTDMRAHRNPTRMHQIALLADQLAERLATLCPHCAAPGYGTIDAHRGLRCALCAAPTDWIATEIDGCARCPLRAQRPRRDGLTAADPAECPACNP